MTLRRAYDEIMEHVAVTEQMRQRLLSRVENADLGHSGSAARVPVLRRYWAAAACAAVLLVSAAVLPRYLGGWQAEPAPDHVETISPFMAVSSLTELEDAVGFQVEELTELPFEAADTVYTVIGGKIAEIQYCGETETAVLRKAAGTEDPSGDYTQYAEELALDLRGTAVTLKGEGGQYVLALWQEGDYAWSLRLSEGMDASSWEQLLLPLC